MLDQYGAWLSERHMREDAGVAFLAAGNLGAAMEQCREGNHWRMALSVAGEKFHYACRSWLKLPVFAVRCFVSSKRMGLSLRGSHVQGAFCHSQLMIVVGRDGGVGREIACSCLLGKTCKSCPAFTKY